MPARPWNGPLTFQRQSLTWFFGGSCLALVHHAPENTLLLGNGVLFLVVSATAAVGRTTDSTRASVQPAIVLMDARITSMVTRASVDTLGTQALNRRDRPESRS